MYEVIRLVYLRRNVLEAAAVALAGSSHNTFTCLHPLLQSVHSPQQPLNQIATLNLSLTDRYQAQDLFSCHQSCNFLHCF